MAKKGGAQQLQTDVSTDEEFEKFLERPGLLVMDVYTDWCGPCIGMVGSLKKIKLEMGGDNLQLAICKADTIQALSRFRNKSEPTWLFASNNKIINIMFGTNVPRLMKMIAQELELELGDVTKKVGRKLYDIEEMLPIEMERYNAIKCVEEKAYLIESETAERKRREYLNFVTDKIMTNMSDCGVTIFGPQINRDMYKKIMEPAETQKLTCKDRRVLQITRSDLEVLHFECNNPMSNDVWEYLFGKDLLTCLWKAADGETRSIEEVLGKYVYDCTKTQPCMDEFGNVVPNQTLHSHLPFLQIEVKRSKEVFPEEPKKNEKTKDPPEDVLDELLDGMTVSNDEATCEEAVLSNEDEENGNENECDESAPKEDPEEFTIVPIMPVWTPDNKRSMAAAIYLIYRLHTSAFLPPDPVPEPPHLAMVFEAYKRKEIFEVYDRYKEDVLAYGYFTTSDPNSTELITNSTVLYDTKIPQVSDKLVLKIAKRTNQTLLVFAGYGPCYISLNTVVGEEECKKFFPPGYRTEGDVIKDEEVETTTKKKKKKKKKEGNAVEAVETVEAPEEIGEEAIEEEFLEDEEGSPSGEEGATADEAEGKPE